MDTYQFSRRGCAGIFTVDAESIDDARRLAKAFFKAVLSDFTWKKTIHVESCVGCEDMPEPSDEEIERFLNAAAN